MIFRNHTYWHKFVLKLFIRKRIHDIINRIRISSTVFKINNY